MSNLVHTPQIFKTLPKPCETRGWGILNKKWNTFWSSQMFETPEAARAYVTSYWKRHAHPEFISGYAFVPVVRQMSIEPDAAGIGVRITVASSIEKIANV